jgi:hypothetical protein
MTEMVKTVAFCIVIAIALPIALLAGPSTYRD